MVKKSQSPLFAPTGFYGSNDPTNSVKALKDVVVLRIGFSPTRSASPCYNRPTTHACNTDIQKIHTYTKMNLSIVKWAHTGYSETKPNPDNC